MQKDKLTLVAFGDSITAAGEVPWPALVEEQLQQLLPSRTVSVVNAGVGGNTSREGLARIDEHVLSQQPDLVLVEFGGNDATDEAERHVTLDEFTGNLGVMRERICGEAGAMMVLLTFPPLIDDWHAWGNQPFHAPYGGPDAHIELYRQQTRIFAVEHGLPCIDIDHALREACRRDGTARYIMSDGVHLTIDGNQVIAEAVACALRDILPSFTSVG